MKVYTVYMLLCSDKTYYTGMTNDLERRYAEHRTCFYPDAYTAKRQPVQLVYFEEFQSVWDAIEWEKRLKKWSSAKKEALIERDWDRIGTLAKKRFRSE